MERRQGERYRVWFPMTVVSPEGDEGTAITYDVSTTGLLMACPGQLEVGAQVTLRFKIAEEDEERVLRASVLRVEPNAGGDAPWRFRMAVQFAEPQPHLEALLVAHADD